MQHEARCVAVRGVIRSAGWTNKRTGPPVCHGARGAPRCSKLRTSGARSGPGASALGMRRSMGPGGACGLAAEPTAAENPPALAAPHSPGVPHWRSRAGCAGCFRTWRAASLGPAAEESLGPGDRAHFVDERAQEQGSLLHRFARCVRKRCVCPAVLCGPRRRRPAAQQHAREHRG